MITVACLVAAAALLFWPERPAKQPSPEYTAPVARKPSAKKPVRKRKEAPKNERKD